MEETNPAQQLNHVLGYIINASLGLFTYNTIKDNTQIEDSKLLVEILGKLTDDKYVEYKEVQYFNIPVWAYFSTLEGRLFLQSGGYVEKLKRDKEDSINNLLRNGIVQFGAASAGIYYVLEIIRIYIFPIFQHLCHCEFVWQK